MNLFGDLDMLTIILKALFDGFLCCFFAILGCIFPSPLVLPSTGQVISQESLIVYTTLTISLA
jgi:hypothetical protein